MLKKFHHFARHAGLCAPLMLLLSGCSTISELKNSVTSMFQSEQPARANSPYPMPPASNTASRAGWGASSGGMYQQRRRPAYNPNNPNPSAMPQTNAYPMQPAMPYPTAPSYGSGYPAMSAHNSPLTAMGGMPPAPPAYGSAPTNPMMGGNDGGFASFYDQMPGGAPANTGSYGSAAPNAAYGQPQAYPSQAPSMPTMGSYGGGGGFDMPNMNGYPMPNAPDVPSEADYQRHLQSLGWGKNSSGNYNPWSNYKPEPVFEPMAAQYHMDADAYEQQSGFQLALLEDSYRNLSTVPDAPADLERLKAQRDSFEALEYKRDEANRLNEEIRHPGQAVGILGDEMHAQEDINVDLTSPSETSPSFLGWLQELITINIGKENQHFNDNPHHKERSNIWHLAPKRSAASADAKPYIEPEPSYRHASTQASREKSLAPSINRLASPPVAVPTQARKSVILTPSRYRDR